MSAWRRQGRTREAGFNLVEILIAMFIFSIGVLQIMAIFPIAIYSGTRAINQVEGHLLGQTALAVFQYELVTPLEGRSVGTGSTSANIVVAGSPSWYLNQWQDYFVTALLQGTVGRETAPIGADADADPTTLSTSLSAAPAVGSNFSITRRGWPPAATTLEVRECRVNDFDTFARRIRAEYPIGHPNEGSPVTSWAVNRWQNHFVIMLSGRAERKVYEIANSDAAGNLIIEGTASTEVNFEKDRLAKGDRFFIAGHAPAAGYPVTIPGNFGTPNPSPANVPRRQTALSSLNSDFRCPVYYDDSGTWKARYVERGIVYPLAPEYVWTIILSDQVDNDKRGVRADVLVFYNFDETKTPAASRPAVSHLVRSVREP